MTTPQVSPVFFSLRVFSGLRAISGLTVWCLLCGLLPLFGAADAPSTSTPNGKQVPAAAPTGVRAQSTSTTDDVSPISDPTTDSASDRVAAAAVEIDRIIAAGWKENGVTPAPPCDDAEFYRRISLDICGRIPAASDVRDFLADDAPDKRRAAVERLLATPVYIVHYTNLWRAALLPEADADQQIRFFLPGFEAWLRSRLAENRNYAEICREIITLPVEAEQVQGFTQAETPTPLAFYRAKEGKPENLASATTRTFLGVRLECAQCHDHPFDHWKQNEFWSYAAFFKELQPTVMPDANGQPIPVPPDGLDRVSLRVPGTETVARAAFLDGRSPEMVDDARVRSILADWMTSPENPYFARAAVNRMWAHHFGIGLVDPVDDFGANNPPSHPELLDFLAREFVASQYNFKFLIRAITASQTYQLSSRRTDDSQDLRQSFARMPVRALIPEQIFDSLAQATGYQQPFNPEEALNFNNDPARQAFLENFANDSETTMERSSTILQALQLMNGEFVADATDLTGSQTLAAVIDAPFLDADGQVEALFLAALGRVPQPAERERFVAYVASGGARQNEGYALSDVFWALLNSSEFLTNH